MLHCAYLSESDRDSYEDPTDSNHSNNDSLKTTNFSISEILRPEFGQRKPGDVPGSLLSTDGVNSYPFQHRGTPPRPLISFDDLFSRYKTFMCSSASSALNRQDMRTGMTKDQNEAEKLIDKPDSDSNSSVWPAWVYCTRYSDRPSAGPRMKKLKSKSKTKSEEKRQRTAFTNDQLQKLKKEFSECRYLSEKRRIALAKELDLSETQIKIWFQNKRAKLKKTSDTKNTLALNLIAEGLYNHSVSNTDQT